MAIVKAIGCRGKRDDYMISCGYIVSWCIEIYYNFIGKIEEIP